MSHQLDDPNDTPYATAPSPTARPPWLPPGATLNADGSVTLYNGNVVAAPAPGYTRDPQTGIINYTGGAPMETGPYTSPFAKQPPPAPPGPPGPPTGPTFASPPGPEAGPDLSGPAGAAGTSSGPSTGATGAPGASAAPNYTPPPAFVKPPDFRYDDFKGPTGQDVLNDPDYQLTRDQGIMAIGHKNAALGTLNTGGTIGDYVGFASNLAHAKYGDLYNRAQNTYATNRANAFDTYKTNYGIGRDVYDTNYQTQSRDPFTNNLESARFGQQDRQLGQQNNQFNAQLGQNNQQFNSTFDFEKWRENYRRNVSDPFERQYRTLGLL